MDSDDQELLEDYYKYSISGDDVNLRVISTALYEKHHKRIEETIARIAFRFGLRQPIQNAITEIAEIVSIVWKEIFQQLQINAQKGKCIGDFCSWSNSFTYNVVIDLFKKHKKYTEELTGVVYEKETNKYKKDLGQAQGVETPEEILINNERDLLIHNLVGKLPPKIREIIELHYLQEIPIKQME